MSQTKVATAFLMLGTALLAQTPAPSDAPHPWRRADAADEQRAAIAPDLPDPPLMAQGAPNQAPPPPPPVFTSSPSFSQQAPAPRVSPDTPLPQTFAPRQTAPARLTVRPGTFLTVRVNQFHSSDKSQAGEPFFASLAEPLIVDGVVVAQRGQTVMGRVTEARKAGRTEGTSRLGLELTSLTLVDGQQVPLQSQMIGREGETSVGRDAGAVAATTALGAVIGGAADYGRGAAIGAGAGAAAGILGVLFTRGRASEVYPETPLTFRINSAVEINTERAVQAFRYAESADYGHNSYAHVAPRRVVQPAVVSPFYYSPYYYEPYPYFGGSFFSFGFGRSYGLYRPYGGYRGSFGGGVGFRRGRR